MQGFVLIEKLCPQKPTETPRRHRHQIGSPRRPRNTPVGCRAYKFFGLKLPDSARDGEVTPSFLGGSRAGGCNFCTPCA